MKLLRYLKFCRLLLKFKLSRQMMYSFNFLGAFFVDLTIFLIQIAVFSSIFLQVDNINGWNRYQMIFFVGTFTILDSIYMCLYFFGVIGIPDKIRTGKLDTYITKPVNTLFLLSFESMDIGSIFLTLPGLIMIAYSAGKLGIQLTVWNITGYLFLVMMMLILMYDLMILIRSAAFWFTSINSLWEFEGEMVQFSFRIPAIAFQGISKLIFYIILPYGLMATIPTQFFTGYLDGQHWLMTIAVCVAFTFLSQFVWKQGLKHYGSASS